jgi:formate dehydrogenase subunit gamma
LPKSSRRAHRASDASRPSTATKVYRFQWGERFLHWALALPYVLLYATAAALLFTWGEAASRPIHHAAAWMHRFAGVCLIALPPLGVLVGIRDWQVHLENVRHGWLWDRNDFRWLILFPRAAVDPRVTLPEQGKFNAAEKLNFMLVMVTYPLYVITGLLVWMPGVAFYSWLAHVISAVLGLPMLVGHIYMATVNPSTRIGLQGMITGWVDREWAKHHYRRWYRQCFESEEAVRRPQVAKPALGSPAQIRCPQCRFNYPFDSWQALLQRTFQTEPLFCPKCETEIVVMTAEARPEMLEEILRHLESGLASVPFDRSASPAA